jgi:hypothetical protein
MRRCWSGDSCMSSRRRSGLSRPTDRRIRRLPQLMLMKRRYIALIVAGSAVLTIAVISAFRAGLVLRMSHVGWLPLSLAVALVAFGLFCALRYRFGRLAPQQSRLMLSLAVGNAFLGISCLIAILWSPSTAGLNWIPVGFVIASVVLFKVLILRTSFAARRQSPH